MITKKTEVEFKMQLLQQLLANENPILHYRVFEQDGRAAIALVASYGDEGVIPLAFVADNETMRSWARDMQKPEASHRRIGFVH